MLEQFEIHSTIPAHDLNRARKFYAEKLGAAMQTRIVVYAHFDHFTIR